MKSGSVPERVRVRLLPRAGILLFLCAAMSLLLTIKPKAYSTTRKFNMRVGQTVQLSLPGVEESLIWRVQTGRKRVRLNQDGMLKAKRTGTAVILVNYNGVTYRFRVKIRDRKSSQRMDVRLIELPVPLAVFPAPAPEDRVPRVKLATTTGERVTEDRMILVGDSRFAGMKQAVGGNAAWITAVGEGVLWLRDSVIPKLNGMDVSGRAVVFNLGVNDLTQTPTYLSVLAGLGSSLRKRGATVYFMTVNPVDEEKEAAYGYKVTNQSIVQFNRTIATTLKGFGIINTYDYLADKGFQTVDGLHYTKDVYRMIYSAVCYSIRK